MIESLQIISASSVPVVPLSVAKAHCRVDSGDTTEDALLGLYIGAATTAAEAYLKRTLVQTQYQLTRDVLPVQIGGPTGNIAFNVFLNSTVFPFTLARAFGVLKPPLISVDSIRYRDTSGTWLTLDPSLYVYVTGNPGRIAPAYGKVWPFTLPEIGSVEITYTAGSGTTTAVVSISGGTTTTVTTVTGPGQVTPAVLDGSGNVIAPALPYITTIDLAPTLPSDVAGTTVITNVQPTIQAGILLWVGSLFRNREAVTEGSMAALPMGVKELFDTANRGYYV